MRLEDTEIIANICSFERMEAAINEFQPFKAPGPDGLYLVLLQKGWKLTEWILPCHFSSMLETQLCAIGFKRRHRYISPQTRKEAILKLNPSV